MKDLKMILLWTSGAIYVGLIFIQLVGVQPVENLSFLLEVSSLPVILLFYFKLHIHYFIGMSILLACIYTCMHAWPHRGQ